MKSIAVFCASSEGNNQTYLDRASEVGAFLAKHKITTVYGGAKIGLMGAVANGALAHEGKVIGVIPGFLKTKEVAHTHLTQLISVETMHERKTKMSELADGFIVLPGGFGTMEEFFEILTWAQLGLHQKPIGVLNINGYYNSLTLLFKRMHDDQLTTKNNVEMVLMSDKIEELFSLMKDYQPQPVPNWLNESGNT